MTMVSARRAGQAAGALAWVALVLGVGASLAANVIAADPGLVDPAVLRRVVAGWPPLALGISFELLVRQLRSDGPVSTHCTGLAEVDLHGHEANRIGTVLGGDSRGPDGSPRQVRG